MKFEINIPEKEGMKDNDIDNLVSFIQSIDYTDVRLLLEGSEIKWTTNNITMKRK